MPSSPPSAVFDGIPSQKIRATRIERLWRRIQKNPVTGCWIWVGYKTHEGYGMVGSGGRGPVKSVHRLMYEILVEPIEVGLELDHLCVNPPCCNPAHLEPVTPAENRRRSNIGAFNRAKTHCPKGHPYAGENLYTYKKRNSIIRACKECGRESVRAMRRRRKAAA